MMAQRRLVAAGPAGDDQGRDVEADPLAVALLGREVEFEHGFYASAKNFQN